MILPCSSMPYLTPSHIRKGFPKYLSVVVLDVFKPEPQSEQEISSHEKTSFEPVRLGT